MRMKKVLSFVLAMVMTISVIPAFAETDLSQSIKNGLIAYYDFEHDAGSPSTIIDCSGSGHEATVLNTVVTGSDWWDPGANNVLTVSDGVAHFPGMTSTWGGAHLGAALKLPYNIHENVSSFSFSAWINADSSYEYNNGATRFFDFGNIGSGSNNTFNSIFARYTPSSGNLRIQDRGIASGSSDEKSLVETTLSTMPFTDAWGLFTLVYEWNAITGCYQTTVYVNGEKVEELSSSDKFTRAWSDLGELNDASNGLFIGRTVWGAANSYRTDNPDFCGMMDEIRIYERGLTEDEVKYLYETTSPVGNITMSTYYVDDVTTLAGDYPLLPETVSVEYNTGAIIEETVTWDIISSEKYAGAGTFKVSGVTSVGNEVEVTVIVIKKDTSTLGEGLVVYYSFDNDSSTPVAITDESGNSNNGIVDNVYQTIDDRWQQTTIESNITVADGVAIFAGAGIGSDFGVTSGRYRNTYFKGPAIKMPASAVEGVEEFTYAAWIYADTDYRYSASIQRLFDLGNSSSDTNSFFFRYNPATGETRFQDRGVASSGDDSNSLISATLEDNPFKDNWAHLVVTYEKSDAGEYYTPHVYINGVERYEYDNSLTTLTRGLSDIAVTDSTNGLWIGRTQWDNSDNPDFKGKMDEIRLYDRALSASEVSELYSSKKPSDVPVDYDSMPKTQLAIVEDVELSGKYPSTNMNGEAELMVSSNNGAEYTRYALMRTGELSVGEITSAANCEKAILSVYVNYVANWDEDEYYCYGLTGDSDSWDVDSVTFENYAEYIGGSITDVGVSEVGELLDTQKATGGDSNFYMQWDVTEFVKEHAAEGFSFLITCGSDCVYIKSSESEAEGQMPELIIYQQGTPITVKRVDTEGNEISTSVVYGVMGESYTYNVADALVSYNNSIYVVNKDLSSLTVDAVTGEDVVEVVYEKATHVGYETVSVRTYIGKAPTLPRVLTVNAGGYSAQFAVQWDSVDADNYSRPGEFDVTGVILGTNVPIEGVVTVFPEYNGGVGTDLTLYVYVDGELREEIAVTKSYGTTFTLSESYKDYMGKLYELDSIEGDVTELGGSVVMNKLGQHVELYYVMKEELEATATVKIKADDFEATSYTLTATATVLNTEKTDETVMIAIADYDDGGWMTSFVTEKILVESRTGETETVTKSIPYDLANSDGIVVYFWNSDLEPLCEAVAAKDVTISSYLPDEVQAMMPTYESAEATIRKANTFWQSYQSYDNWYAGTHPAFWDKAAYHTGNMEVYKLLGDEDMLQYTINWANYNNWKGHPSTADPSEWTWGYNQDTNSKAVLFGDWQICFQTYIDLYNLDQSGELEIEGASVDRVLEVMGYQITKEEDSFWWWADALYMVMPVMTKLYKLTDDEAYLDALYKYFKFAKELMYDGPGGIPTDETGYTTTAYNSKNSGSYFSDPEDYKYLFFRDAGYVYPLQPNTGHADEKNFWARGNGWVFAGLSKVLADMPESYEHYDEFYNTYMEMAPAIISCQSVDDNGYGFWTQSMLQGYPTSNSNPYGYETSGTAFFTYGLFWGINNGLLDEETYLEPAVRAWGYLNNVALQDSGMVGYGQYIGSNASAAMSSGDTQNFTVGAFLLASCEAARYAQNN